MSRFLKLKELELKIRTFELTYDCTFFALVKDKETGKMILDKTRSDKIPFTGERKEKFDKMLKEFIDGYSNLLKEEMFLAKKEFEELDHD